MRYKDRYIFQGQAVGFEAHIRQPQDHICWIQGAMALPPTGGYGRVESGPEECAVPCRNSRYSFDSVAGYTSGDFIENPDGRVYPDVPTRTVTASYVNGLNILDRVSIDTLAAHLTVEDLTDKAQPEYRFGTVNPINGLLDPLDPIEGLKVDGFSVKVEFDRAFWRLYTKADCDKHYKAEGRITDTTIVKSLSWAQGEAKGVYFDGNTIVVNGLGRIYLGEFLVADRARQLTLVRVELEGDQRRGNDSGGNITSGPLPWPPDQA